MSSDLPWILPAALGLAVGLATGVHARASSDLQARPGWLTGTWVLCEDPDNGPRDTIQFNVDGTGLSLGPGGSSFAFGYTVDGDGVQVFMPRKSDSPRLDITASPDHTKLVTTGYGPDHASTYVRRGTEETYRCTVR